ncbi:hypothetical protein HDU81_000204 [Chytriomyces hyalinus]|nr:hypothetical protein HDU81_000204 [Chytriomyces hyalinus]
MRGQNKTAGTAHEFNKRTVHIPGSHALPPGINTNMAWEMGYSRKRLDSDTKGIENTVNHATYCLGEKLDTSSRSASDHARILQAMSDSLHVSKGSDIRNLDTLNPYFMHLELIKRRYAVEGDALWGRMGAAGDDTGDLIHRESRDTTAGTQAHVHANGRVPVGGWPSGLEFEMGVHFMPGGMLVDSSLDAAFAPHAAVTKATISAAEETASAAVDDPYVLRMLAEAELERDAEVENAYGHEQVAAEDVAVAVLHENEKDTEDGDKKDEKTESSSPAEEVKVTVPSFKPASPEERRISTIATTRQIIEAEPKHNLEDNRPMQSSFSPFFPLPAVQSVATSNPTTLPQCYAVNRRYHSNPVHPDSLQDSAIRASNSASPLPQQLAIHAKYLDTYNTVALVNGRPTARAIPGTSAIPPPPSSGAKPLLPVYSRMANVPLTTSAIAAISG